MLRVPTSEPTAQPPADTDDLAPEIRRVLAALAEMEIQYQSSRESLGEWYGAEAVRKRLLDILEARYMREREPLVQRLAELHQRIAMTSMFRNLGFAR